MDYSPPAPLHNKQTQGGLAGGGDGVIVCLRCALVLLISISFSVRLAHSYLLSFFFFFFSFFFLSLPLTLPLSVSLALSFFLCALQSGGNIRGIRLA